MSMFLEVRTANSLRSFEINVNGDVGMMKAPFLSLTYDFFRDIKAPKGELKVKTRFLYLFQNYFTILAGNNCGM